MNNCDAKDFRACPVEKYPRHPTVIRKRFDDEMIELLLKVQWWDRDSHSISSILPLLCNNDLNYVKEQLEKLLKI